MSDLSSLLDMNLDSLADLPEFVNFHPGAHRCTIEFASKEINKHPAIEAKLKLIETLELSNAEDVAQASGTETSVAYMLDNEFGQGNFKKLMKPLADHFSTDNVAQIIEQAKGTEVVLVTKLRANKDKSVFYMDIVSLQVV